MIHARRIKPKKTSTKDMLQNTVSANNGVENMPNNTVAASMGGASEVNATRSKVGSKAGAFDAAFGKSRPFSKVLKKGLRSKTNNRIVANNPRRKLINRLILLAIISMLVFTLLSMSFRTKEFLVEGNVHLDTSEVQMLSKIYAGTPLLWVSDRNIKNLLRNPWVDNVKINRVFPHTVLIKLRERTPVAVLSNDSIKADRVDFARQSELGIEQNLIGQIGVVKAGVAYAADGVVLPNVPEEVLERLTPIDGWGEDRSLEGLELFNHFTTMPELEVTKINYTPEGFEASFKYGLQDLVSNETSFILGQLQTPSLTLLKEHQSAFVHALMTEEEGELTNMASSLDDSFTQRLIVPAPQPSLESSGLGEGQALNQETGRIVKRKWITVYGWGVSLSE